MIKFRALIAYFLPTTDTELQVNPVSDKFVIPYFLGNSIMEQSLDKATIFQKLFEQAISEPGKLARYYSYFHNYSFGNMLLLMFQGVTEPVASFNKWGLLNRRVKKGSKAKTICMPNSRKGTRTNADGDEEEFGYKTFQLKNCLFTLSDTQGDELYTPEVELPRFDKFRLLAELGIQEVVFDKLSGNIQGFSRPSLKQVSISPIAVYPVKTLLHEVAHCLLHERNDDGLVVDHGIEIPREIREVEAESTAYLLGSFLGILSDKELTLSRGYIQNWTKKAPLPENTCRRVIGAVEKMLKALGKGAECGADIESAA